MNFEDIVRHIKIGEGIRTEFKEAKNSVPKSFFETVVSFANSDGGIILLGVDDNGDITGIDENSVPKLKKEIVTSLNSKDCINPPVYVQPVETSVNDKIIITVHIESSSQVHDYSGTVFIREFESDIDITDNKNKLSDLYLRKRNSFTESTIYPYLTMNDLDKDLFEKARQLIRNYRSDHPWLLVSNEQMLKDSVLWRKDFQTSQEGFTLACALIFGKDTTIQSILSAYKVEAMVRRENHDRWDDRITLRKNLIDTYLELKMFINRHLPEKFYLENDQRIDLRDKIFREVIGNIIVHREYTSALSTEIIISDSDVCITNPNRALFHGYIDPLSFNPFPKNPNIRKFFTAFGWTDEIGSGVRNTYKYLPLYSNHAKPVFIEDETFKTIIPLNLSLLSDYLEELFKWFDLPPDAKEHFTKSTAEISIAGSFRKNPCDEVILELVRSWMEFGTQLDSLNWPQNQPLTKEDIKKVPAWNELSTQLLHKKVRYYLLILILALKPIKLKELMHFLDYKNEKIFRDNYIKPLRDTGLITITHPETPTNPENRYKTTESGKNFVSGVR